MSGPQISQIGLSSGTILTLVGMAGTVSVLLVSISLYVGRIRAEVSGMEAKVDTLDIGFENLKENSLTSVDCAKEQRVWEARVERYLSEIKIRDEANKKEHLDIVKILDAHNELQLRLAAENNERYAAIEDCLKQLQLQKEC